MGLPASVVILGVFVEAFEARRSRGAKACFLRDRTARRAFAGRCRPRHWCCPLSAFLDHLVDRGIVDPSNAPEPIGESLLFFAFASTMVAWDAVAPVARAPLRAHARFLAADIAQKIALLHHAGIAFIGSRPHGTRQTWASWTDRAAPFSALGNDGRSAEDLAGLLGVYPRTAKRWLDGRRPDDESLQHIAAELAERSDGDVDREHRELLLHYSLSDLLRDFCSPHRALDGEAWLTAAEATELVTVVGDAIECAKSRDTPGRSRDSFAKSALATPSDRWLAHLADHGAADWSEDLSVAKTDYRAAGIIAPEDDFAHPLRRFAHALTAMPTARPAELAQRRVHRRG